MNHPRTMANKSITIHTVTDNDHVLMQTLLFVGFDVVMLTVHPWHTFCDLLVTNYNNYFIIAFPPESTSIHSLPLCTMHELYIEKFIPHNINASYEIAELHRCV